VFDTARNAPVAELEERKEERVEGVACATLSMNWKNPALDECIDVRHRREVQLSAEKDSQCLSITDDCLLDRSSTLSLYWHFAPVWMLQRKGNGELVATDSDAKEINIRVDFEPSWTCRIENYDYSNVYGEIKTGQRLVVTFSNTKRAHGRTEFRADGA
jgi:hypothetical protein